MDEKNGKFETGYESLNQLSSKRQGGFRASLFIFGLLALENMGFVANMVSMVLYFMLVMHFDLASSANTLTNFLGSTFLLTLVGGFISDTYLTRLNTCLLFGLVEILALIMVTTQAHFHELQPDPCGKSRCVHGSKALMFYSSIFLLALGAGGVKGSLPALGGDQFNQKGEIKGSIKSLASFFSWLLLSTTFGGVIGVTVIVWVSMNKGWDAGFFIITLAASIGFIILALGKPFYRVESPGDSPILRVIQVLVVAFRNRNLLLPAADHHSSSIQLYDNSHEDQRSLEQEKLLRTKQFRFFDKAAILPQNSATAVGPWKVCTVTQVEEVKILTRMLPIIGSTILVNTCLAQLQTFSVQQGNLMDLSLGSFKVPAASIPVIPLFFVILLIPIYEFLFVPLARKITNHPSGITQLQRVGIGLFLSVVSMAIAGFVEVKRRHRAIKDPTKPISLFWLSFQFAVFGIADMFTVVGLLDFFYREAPSGNMRSLSTSFTFLSQSMGYFLSSVLVDLINSISRRLSKNKEGWLHGQDLNKSHLDLFYWFLAILSLLNFVNYLFWATWYKYKTTTNHDNGTASFELKERAPDRDELLLPYLKEEITTIHLDATSAAAAAAAASYKSNAVLK